MGFSRQEYWSTPSAPGRRGRRALGGAEPRSGRRCALQRGGGTRPPSRGGRGAPRPPPPPSGMRRVTPLGPGALSPGEAAGGRDRRPRDPPRSFPVNPPAIKTPLSPACSPSYGSWQDPLFSPNSSRRLGGSPKIHPLQASKLSPNRTPTNERSTPTELGWGRGPSRGWEEGASWEPVPERSGRGEQVRGPGWPGGRGPLRKILRALHFKCVHSRSISPTFYSWSPASEL